MGIFKRYIALSKQISFAGRFLLGSKTIDVSAFLSCSIVGGKNIFIYDQKLFLIDEVMMKYFSRLLVYVLARLVNSSTD